MTQRVKESDQMPKTNVREHMRKLKDKTTKVTRHLREIPGKKISGAEEAAMDGSSEEVPLPQDPEKKGVFCSGCSHLYLEMTEFPCNVCKPGSELSRHTTIDEWSDRKHHDADDPALLAYTHDHPEGYEVDAYLNPNGWFNETWILGIGAGYGMHTFVVEAEHEQAVMDEFADSKHAHLTRIPDEDLKDHEEWGTITYAGNGGDPHDFSDVRILKKCKIKTNPMTIGHDYSGVK